jgi:FlaA1/EpsC-like NDP-sugar epimerase
VLASRGSVVPTFARQIAQGGPVTVTDPRMTRYFMSIREAVELVLQSAALSKGGEIFMLDMGEPVRIVDLASRMVRLSGRKEGVDVEIRITGIRPGEKLTECLYGPKEQMEATEHPSIRRIQGVFEEPESLHSEICRLNRLCESGERKLLAAGMKTTARGGLIDVGESIDLRDTGAVLTSDRTDSWELIDIRDPTPLGGMPAAVQMTPSEWRDGTMKSGVE